MPTYILTITLGTFILSTAFDSSFLAERARVRALANGATGATVERKVRP